MRNLHNHMSVCNLQRLEDARSILSNVDDRQQAVRQQAVRQRLCRNTELLNFLLITTSMLQFFKIIALTKLCTHKAQ